MEITLDISGFFFHREVTVKKGATIKDVMDAAVDQNNNNGNEALFFYEAGDDSERLFVDTIYVVHKEGTAVSRQTLDSKARRVYPEGVYGFKDDAVVMKDGRLAPKEELPGQRKGSVAAWQYYIYDRDGVDLSRKSDGVKRKIVPYSTSSKDFPLEDGYTVVWRLIHLQLEPNGVMGMKPTKPSILV